MQTSEVGQARGGRPVVGTRVISTVLSGQPKRDQSPPISRILSLGWREPPGWASLFGGDAQPMHNPYQGTYSCTFRIGRWRFVFGARSIWSRFDRADGIEEGGPFRASEVQDGAVGAFLGVAYADGAVGRTAHLYALAVGGAVAGLAPMGVWSRHAYDPARSVSSLATFSRSVRLLTVEREAPLMRSYIST